MQLWDYLLVEDQRLDLSNPDTATEWLQGQPWGIRGDAAAAPPNWTRNLLALRNLARRLKPQHNRWSPDGLENDLFADAILRDYLGLMRPSLVLAAAPDTPPSSLLTARTFRGLQLLPTFALHTPLPLDSSGTRTVDRLSVEWRPNHCGGDACGHLFIWRDDGAVFWQVVFHSLVADSGPAICQTCGALLGDSTPTGRKKKQAHCARCRWRAWSKKQSASSKRAKWRADYAKRMGD
jgi:hypothetical protein